MNMRVLPTLSSSTTSATRPISFVCVHFSGDLDHNFLKSTCVHDPLNQLILVDNRSNVFFSNLGAALNEGIKKARHELVVLVHEDVFLVQDWQQKFETSLQELEQVHPDWGMVGAVGWDDSGAVHGHWSDPRETVPKNTFTDRNYAQVSRLDEQILVLRRSRAITPDPDLPSIHLIGRDLARRLKEQQLSTFAINAPTVHKYADSNGKPIAGPKDSPKILGRSSLTFKAEHDVCKAYFNHKFGLVDPSTSTQAAPSLSADQQAILESPIILVGRGGGGTRLISFIAQDCGLYLGNEVNRSGDCIDLVLPVYRSALRRLSCTDAHSPTLIQDDLRNSASSMLEKAGWPKPWGFKLPESTLILPDLHSAFPNARFVWFARDPKATVLRRSHMTGRLDNEIGRASVAAAYDYIGRPRDAILTDTPLVHMAITTRHQTDLLDDFFARLPPERSLRLSFEDTVEQPNASLESFSAFTNLPIQTNRIAELIDKKRSQTKLTEYSDKDIDDALRFLTAKP